MNPETEFENQSVPKEEEELAQTVASNEGKPDKDKPVSSEKELEAGRRRAIAELLGTIDGKLRDAAYDKLDTGNIERIVLRDAEGNEFGYRMTTDEAQEVEKALWTAGENAYLEQFREHIVAQAARNGLIIDSPSSAVSVELETSKKRPMARLRPSGKRRAKPAQADEDRLAA